MAAEVFHHAPTIPGVSVGYERKNDCGHSVNISEYAQIPTPLPLPILRLPRGRRAERLQSAAFDWKAHCHLDCRGRVIDPTVCQTVSEGRKSVKIMANRTHCNCERALRMNSFVAAWALHELEKFDRKKVEQILAEVKRKYGESGQFIGVQSPIPSASSQSSDPA